MKNIEFFIAEINEACDDGEHWVKVDIDTLRVGDYAHMTDEELLELDQVLKDEETVRHMLEDLYEIYDCGEPRQPVPPIVRGAYEWLVGPFEVSHKNYDPYWWRTK